jgi:hypothetical protein
MSDNLTPQKESIGDALKKYSESRGIVNDEQVVTNVNIPKASYNQQDYEQLMSKETDPDLITSYEIVKLPSNGLFYSNRISEVKIEYMTSKDEDLLTTPSLIENGTVLDVLLKRKIKTPGINVDTLLEGDRNALLLFLRTSSYGSDYTVQVTDPRSGIPFTTKVDLLKLKYKTINELPDENGYFSLEIPMRKKNVKVKLLSSGEDRNIKKRADAIQEAYNEEFNQYNTLKLKATIISINGKTDRSYIDKFVDAMPALDAYAIRRKILDVSPDVDMSYEFMAKDGYTFNANLTVGIDFFFPGI